MANSAGEYQRELVLARLQKAQSSETAQLHLPEGLLLATQLSRVSATLRSRKSRNTLIRFDARNSSG
jgi:hypothetical protein